jgi:hypothetical protein
MERVDMSYNADLINAYRDQLAIIRAAWEILKYESQGSEKWDQSYEMMDKAINSAEADDIESLYPSKEPLTRLPDGPSYVSDDQEWTFDAASTKSTIVGIKNDGSTYTVEIDTDDEDTQA